jgi:hypothetical protein
LEEVTGIWRKLHEEDHHNVYGSLNIIGVKRLMGHVMCMRGMLESCRILPRNLKRPFGASVIERMVILKCVIYIVAYLLKARSVKPAMTHYYTTADKHNDVIKQ